MNGDKSEMTEEAAQELEIAVRSLIDACPWLITICEAVLQLPAMIKKALDRLLFKNHRLVRIAFRRAMIKRRKMRRG